MKALKKETGLVTDNSSARDEEDKVVSWESVGEVMVNVGGNEPGQIKLGGANQVYDFRHIALYGVGRGGVGGAGQLAVGRQADELFDVVLLEKGGGEEEGQRSA